MKRTAQRDDKQHGRYWSVNVIRSTITKGLVTSIVLYTFQFTIWDFWFGHNYATTTCRHGFVLLFTVILFTCFESLDLIFFFSLTFSSYNLFGAAIGIFCFSNLFSC